MKKLLLILTILTIVCPLTAAAVQIKGRVSASLYNQNDDVSSYDYNILTTRLKFDVSEFDGNNKSIHFRGKYRNSGRNDFNGQTPDYRINSASLNINNVFGGIDMVMGRHHIDYLPGARVDGLQASFSMSETYGAGIFGGFKPDPYKDRFLADYYTYGGYGFLKGPESRLSLGYVTTMYKGEEDSSYYYGSAGYYNTGNGFNAYFSIRGDHDIDNGGYDLTNLLARVSYRLGWRFRLSVSHSRYRAIKLYKSMDYDLGHQLQKTWRFYTTYKLTKTTRLYCRYDHRTRDNDNKSASMYMLGMRQNNILRWFFMDLSYQSIRYFSSNITRNQGAIGMDIGEKITVEFNLTKSNSKHDNAPNKLEQLIYGGSVNWYPTRKFYVSGSYELSTEKYLSVDSVYIAQASDEYKRRSVFLMIGYRF